MSILPPIRSRCRCRSIEPTPPARRCIMTFYVRPLCVAALLLAAACDETPPTEIFPESLDAQLRRSIGPWGVTPIGAPPQQEPALAATDGLPLAIGTGGTGTGTARTLGPGRSFVPRNAPSLLNTAIGLSYVFWDGRLTRFGAQPPEVRLPPDPPNVIAAQAMMPVLNRREMRGNPGDLDVFGNPNELAQLTDSQPAQVWQAIMQRLLA